MRLEHVAQEGESLEVDLESLAAADLIGFEDLAE